MHVIVYHNPRCSKSRAVLELIGARAVIARPPARVGEILAEAGPGRGR